MVRRTRKRKRRSTGLRQHPVRLSAADVRLFSWSTAIVELATARATTAATGSSAATCDAAAPGTSAGRAAARSTATALVEWSNSLPRRLDAAAEHRAANHLASPAAAATRTISLH